MQESPLHMLWQALWDNTLSWALLLAVLCIDVLVLLVRTALNTRKRGWNGAWYIVLCAMVACWAALTALSFYWGSPASPHPVVAALRYVPYLFVPGLVASHIWRQVSFRDMPWYLPMSYLAVPMLLAVWALVDILATPTGQAVSLHLHRGLGQVLFVGYYAAMELNCLLLLVSVFYQMPEHMRKPAKYMLAGVLAFILASVFQVLFPVFLPIDFILLATWVLMHILYSAFRVVSSANVVATSRELVLQNLSTIILVLSREGRILDWNTKESQGMVPSRPAHHIIEPQYREGFSHYRGRLLTEGAGRVSAHDANIITFPIEGGEIHYLLSAREMRSQKRKLGYLVEISNVTKIYSIFRTLEETATIDQLTGLYNRNAYLTMARPMTAQDNLPLLVLVGDVNNLKPTNDVHGHLAGDKLLTAVAEIIRQNSPVGALAARVGGDEFVVLIPHGTEGMAETFIAHSANACQRLPVADGFAPGVSWGYAVMRSAEEDYNDVFAAADSMMYATKRQHARFRSSGLVPERQHISLADGEELDDGQGFEIAQNIETYESEE